jgi:hypothetical protein
MVREARVGGKPMDPTTFVVDEIGRSRVPTPLLLDSKAPASESGRWAELMLRGFARRSLERSPECSAFRVIDDAESRSVG